MKLIARSQTITRPVKCYQRIYGWKSRNLLTRIEQNMIACIEAGLATLEDIDTE